MYHIYRITNIKNDKNYIGLTKNTIEGRFDEHKKSGYDLHEAMISLGTHNFSIEEIDSVETIEEATALEKFYVEKYDSFDNGYNMNKGGSGLFIHSDETKKKMSDNNHRRGKDRSGDLNPMFGRKHSAEAIEKMRRNRRGKTAGINHPLYGKKHSDETKKKMSEKATGRPAPNKGVPMSAISKKKLSESKMGIVRNTKKWLLTHPDGTEEIIENMSKYCKENNLHAGNMSSVASGKLKQYKGYFVQVL